MIKIYRDDAANSIFLQDANGAQFTNSLQAILNDTDDTLVSVRDLAKQVDIVSNEPYNEFIDENDNTYGVDGASTVNALNAEFMVSGTSGSEVPVITSSLNISAVSGEVINYELTADFGVGYEWENLPSGLVTSEGNIRKILGSLPSGVYAPTMRAVNYNGSDVQTLTITVSNPPYANTKSVRFNNNDYCFGIPSVLNPLFRAANGTGASDAWSISLYFKAGTSSDQEQTLLMFGGSSQSVEGRVQLWYDGSSNDRHLRLRYGTNNSYLEFETPNNGISQNVWHNILVTYDGGTTGGSPLDISDFYSRFKIFIDGVEQTLNTSHGNFGYSSSILPEYFLLGRNGTSSNYMRNNCKLDEVALFDSDQSSNIATIYNLGVPFDLSSLLNPPSAWWRMGDGDTYPILQDSIGDSDFLMVNMTSLDIVNDAP